MRLDSKNTMESQLFTFSWNLSSANGGYKIVLSLEILALTMQFNIYVPWKPCHSISGYMLQKNHCKWALGFILEIVTAALFATAKNTNTLKVHLSNDKIYLC